MASTSSLLKRTKSVPQGRHSMKSKDMIKYLNEQIRDTSSAVESLQRSLNLKSIKEDEELSGIHQSGRDNKVYVINKAKKALEEKDETINKLVKEIKLLETTDKRQQVALETQTDKIDSLMTQIENENEELAFGLDDLQRTLRTSDLSEHQSAVHFGSVQYGSGNKIFVIHEAKDAIEIQNELIDTLINDVAELTEKEEKNEKLLKTLSKTQTLDSAVKSETIAQLVEDFTANQTDERVLLNGVKSIKQSEFTSNYQSMSVMGRKAIQRVVDKYAFDKLFIRGFGRRSMTYSDSLSCKMFAEYLKVSSAEDLNDLMCQEVPVHMDKDNSARIVVEWLKSPGNTPEEFMKITTEIDRYILAEKSKRLRNEKVKVRKDEIKKKRKSRESLSKSSLSLAQTSIFTQSTGSLDSKDDNGHNSHFYLLNKLEAIGVQMHRRFDEVTGLLKARQPSTEPTAEQITEDRVHPGGVPNFGDLLSNQTDQSVRSTSPENEA